jgi:hypothetical protein
MIFIAVMGRKMMDDLISRKIAYTKKVMRYVLKTAVQMLNEKADVGSE